jgi:hypothetical protein
MALSDAGLAGRLGAIEVAVVCEDDGGAVATYFRVAELVRDFNSSS